MTKMLRLSKELVLPGDVATQKINVLGQSGGGKTYLAMKLAELMLEMPALITAIDLVGVWPGLLSSADGLHPGFPVLVIGGEKGHLPLNPHAGRLTADVVYDRDVSVVLDVSELLAEDEEQLVVFLADFLEQLFLRHKRGKKRRHLFYEEAQEIFPETMSLKGHVRLRRIGTRLCKIGRNYGLGYTTITQEPQSTSKRILNQAGTLIAVRTIGELERKAISGTARSAATQDLDLMNVLPELQTGEAIVWSPAWLKFAGKVRILPKVTFDSSKTPDSDDEAVEPKVLAPVEVEQLRLAMAAAIAKVEAEDPAALKKRIRQLEVELAARPPPAPPVEVKVPVLPPEAIHALSDVREQLERFTKQLGAIEGKIPLFEAHRVALVPATTKRDPLNVTIESPIVRARAQVATQELKGAGLKRGAREMLRELAALKCSLTRRELATRVVMSHSGGSTGDYLSALVSTGFIEKDESGDYRATPAGIGAAGAVRPKSSGELVALWNGTSDFKRGVRAMLDRLLQTPTAWLNREQLAEAAGMETTGGSTGDYISELVASGCADAKQPRGGPYIAGHALFMGDP